MWRILLSNKKTKIQVNRILDEIAISLEKCLESEKGIGLHDGLSGIALFFSYYSKYINTDRYDQLSVDALTKASESIYNGNNIPTICNGLAGYGWTLNHLAKNQFIELPNNDFLEEIDHCTSSN